MRIGRNRVILGMLGVAVLVAGAEGVALAASAQSSPPSSPAKVTYSRSSGGVAAGTLSVGALAGSGTGVVSHGSSSQAVSSPAWCCSAGNPPGLTATGQAMVRGARATVRASAIASAVASAESQAKAAAKAAGVTLGRIISMDVSVPYGPYPLPMGAAASNQRASPAAPGVKGAPSSGGSATMCPAGGPCPNPGFGIYATVTVTWAIG
jgi:Protein of unknown function (DUF541)